MRMTIMPSQNIKNILLNFQKNEITEHIVYSKLAEKTKGENRKILKQISDDELDHYNKWKEYTQMEVPPNRLSIIKYLLLSVIFGLSFTMKIMEGGEEKAQEAYNQVFSEIPEAEEIFKDEKRHEHLLIDMIDEKRLDYVSLIVQGLNDALIELFGELAGFSFALQNPRLIGFAGLIAGIAQFLSSSASELQIYFSEKNEENRKTLNASLSEGTVYLFTVLVLIIPFFTFTNYIQALLITILFSFIVIIIFTFYVSVVKNVSLKKMFFTMASITIAVGTLSFIIGWIAKIVLNL
jgi:VIT1/CCC1 family predicted Fe2+/Mn2+ transporter